MDVKGLAELCLAGPHALLVIPKPIAFKPGERIRLAGRSGPLGRVLNVKENGDRLDVCASFDSTEILRWLVGNGMVRLASKQTIHGDAQ